MRETCNRRKRRGEARTVVGVTVMLAGHAVGTIETPSACIQLHTELFLALVGGEEMGLGTVPSLINHDFPSLHLLVIEHFTCIHALDKILHLGGIRGRHINLVTQLLLFVQHMGKLGDIG
jgi:hypothetical protein